MLSYFYYFHHQVYTIQGSLVNSSNSSSGSSGLNSIAGGPVIFSTQIPQASPDFTNNPLFRSSRHNNVNSYYPNVPVIITPATEANFTSHNLSEDDSDDQVVTGGYLHPANLKRNLGSKKQPQSKKPHNGNNLNQNDDHNNFNNHQQQLQSQQIIEHPIQHPLIGSGDRHLVLQVDTLPTCNRSTHDLFFSVLFICFIAFLVSKSLSR